MAIAFDSSAFGAGTTGTTDTLAITCSGSDRILFWSALVVSATDNLTSVVHNGTAMTLIAHLGGSGERIYLYYLIAPSTGANNIVATFSGSVTTYSEAASYTGASQTGQPDSSATTAFATQVNMSTSTTTVANNSWIVGIFRAAAAQAAIAGTTFRAGINTSVQIGDTNGAKTPAGSYTLGTTFTSAAAAQIIASFKPSVSTNSNFLMFF